MAKRYDVMAFGAHPDDVEFSMAGTLVKFVENGFKVIIIVLTSGGKGTRGTPEIREKEVKNAAKIIGADAEILGFKDTKIFDDYESRLKIAEVIRKYKPTIVFAPYHTIKGSHLDGKAHPDHSNCGELVRNALRLAKFRKIKLSYPHHLVRTLIYYFSPKGREPNILVDVSDQMKKAIKAIKAHESQLSDKFLKMLEVWRKYNGIKIGVEYAEGFFMEDPIKIDVKDFFKI